MTGAPYGSTVNETSVAATENTEGGRSGSRTSMRLLEFKRGGKAPGAFNLKLGETSNAQRNNAYSSCRVCLQIHTPLDQWTI